MIPGDCTVYTGYPVPYCTGYRVRVQYRVPGIRELMSALPGIVLPGTDNRLIPFSGGTRGGVIYPFMFNAHILIVLKRM
jgi:hypothetical protein